jgi:hypothetical protein
MKHIGLPVLVGALIGAMPARAAQWSKTYNISGEPALRVETSEANIRVDTSDQKTIDVNVISLHYKIGPGDCRSKNTRLATRLRSTYGFRGASTLWTSAIIAWILISACLRRAE